MNVSEGGADAARWRGGVTNVSEGGADAATWRGGVANVSDRGTFRHPLYRSAARMPRGGAVV
ncbi:hypothetical protein Q9S36_24080 [Microbacterium sp. ARD31]|uniref:hypothetical protein n=1 Tax=Microbacterium sp. ARD31 TaxID=2962576 RepID=UPI002880BFBE|nr:hypothetical protein [Microbacterium sp. ARD31]MDT0183268.1 hypothetical protein [Microbacterium sp. ARD31]